MHQSLQYFKPEHKAAFHSCRTILRKDKFSLKNCRWPSVRPWTLWNTPWTLNMKYCRAPTSNLLHANIPEYSEYLGSFPFSLITQMIATALLRQLVECFGKAQNCLQLKEKSCCGFKRILCNSWQWQIAFFKDINSQFWVNTVVTFELVFLCLKNAKETYPKCSLVLAPFVAPQRAQRKKKWLYSGSESFPLFDCTVLEFQDYGANSDPIKSNL